MSSFALRQDGQLAGNNQRSPEGVAKSNFCMSNPPYWFVSRVFPATLLTTCDENSDHFASLPRI